MLKEEVIIRVLSKFGLDGRVHNQESLRLILEEVLSDYEVNTSCKELAVSNDLDYKINLYLASKKLDGLSYTTLSNYELNLKNFSKMVAKHTVDITIMDIRAYLAYMSRERNVKLSTLETQKSILKSFFGWLELEEFIEKNPTKKLKPTKVEKNTRVSLTEEELEKLRIACKTSRQRALVEFMFSTGCRLAELISIDKSDINWHDNSIRIKGKGSKWRTVYFNSKAKIYLETYLISRKDEKDALFVSERSPHNRIQNRAIQNEIKKLGKFAKIEKPVFPHILRHSFATLALKSGMPLPVIQVLMGHEDCSTTQIYAKQDLESVRIEYRKHLTQ